MVSVLLWLVQMLPDGDGYILPTTAQVSRAFTGSTPRAFQTHMLPAEIPIAPEGGRVFESSVVQFFFPNRDRNDN